MSQLLPGELALLNLYGEVLKSEREYMTRDEAFALLREISGIDLGEDVEKWAVWVRKEYEHLPKPEDCD